MFIRHSGFVTVGLVTLALVQPSSGRLSAADVRLPQAVQKADAAEVKRLIAEHADVNAREADGSTALLWAAYAGNAEIARTLIAAGADVNAANRYGLTPLIQAARVGASGIVDALVRAGADVKAHLPEGETALMAASGSGDLASVKLLITRGADVNAKEVTQNQTAVMWAADAGHGDIIRALTTAGADPSVVALPSQLPRSISGDAGGRMWTDHASGGLDALMFAARQGHIDAINALAEAKANLNYENPDHMTALMLAVLNDHADAADALLQRGASTDDGALYEAVVLHNLRTNETAGEATRPRPWHDNKVSPTALIAHLLEHGADPNRAATHVIHFDGTGGAGAAAANVGINEAPFARALRAQDVEAITLMLAHGAKPNEAVGGQLPLAIAMGAGGGGRGFAGGFGAQPAGFRFAGDRTPAAAVAALLDAGADVNAVNDAGNTPLHAAAQTGNVAMIRLFAQRGAKLETQNKAGFTALDLAMGKGAPAPAPARGGGGGAPPGRGPAGPQPQPQAIAALRELMGLPPLSPEELQNLGGAGRGGPGRGRGGN